MTADAYATDEDLLIYAPDVSSVSASLRELALEDAEAMIDARWYGNKTRRAHAMLAAHYLTLQGLVSGGEGGVPSSKSAGDISVSYAVTALPAGDSLFATTKYGRMFLELTKTVPHSGASA